MLNLKPTNILDIVNRKTKNTISIDSCGSSKKVIWSTIKTKEQLGIRNKNLILSGDDFPENADSGQVFIKDGIMFQKSEEGWDEVSAMPSIDDIIAALPPFEIDGSGVSEDTVTTLINEIFPITSNQIESLDGVKVTGTIDISQIPSIPVSKITNFHAIYDQKADVRDITDIRTRLNNKADTSDLTDLQSTINDELSSIYDQLTTMDDVKADRSEIDAKADRTELDDVVAAIPTIDDIIAALPPPEVGNPGVSEDTVTTLINEIFPITSDQIESLDGVKLTGTIDISQIPSIPVSKITNFHAIYDQKADVRDITDIRTRLNNKADTSDLTDLQSTINDQLSTINYELSTINSTKADTSDLSDLQSAINDQLSTLNDQLSATNDQLSAINEELTEKINDLETALENSIAEFNSFKNIVENVFTSEWGDWSTRGGNLGLGGVGTVDPNPPGGGIGPIDPDE